MWCTARHRRRAGARPGAAVGMLAVLAVAIVATGILPVSQDEAHCGVACLATLLKMHDSGGQSATQFDLALQHNARIPEFRSRYPDEYLPMQYYPEFAFSYQPILAEMLIERGFCVISTNADRDGETGKPPADRVQLLADLLHAGRTGIVNLDNHYLVVTGFDAATQRMRIVDPLRPTQYFSAGFETFVDGESKWHTNPAGEPMRPWRGRLLFCWKAGDDAASHCNKAGQCPNCESGNPGDGIYCGQCGVQIYRPGDPATGRALDALALAAVDRNQTDLDAKAVAAARDRFPEAAWRSALLHYPLVPREDGPLITVSMILHEHGVDSATVPIPALEAVVCAGRDWPEVIAR